MELRSCFSFCGNSSFDLPKPAILIVDVCFSKESPQTSYRGCLPTHMLIVRVLKKILLDPHPSVLIFSTLKPMIVRYQLSIWRLFLWAHFGFNVPLEFKAQTQLWGFFGSVDSIDPIANELAPPLLLVVRFFLLSMKFIAFWETKKKHRSMIRNVRS